MCALFGFLDYGHQFSPRVLQKLVQALANASEVRGNHASGIAYNQGDHLTIYKRPKPAHKLKFRLPDGTSAVMGHTRFTTQGSEKQNHNNHPFRGNAGMEFALAHNGVLYNDHELRIVEKLPQTEIETDSYIAVQLLEKQGKLDFDSLKSMAEDVCGSYTFTILTQSNTLYIIKGSSPIYLVHFPELGLYVYASTGAIMMEALEKTGMQHLDYQIIEVTDGMIVKITPDGNIDSTEFKVNEFGYPAHTLWSFDTMQQPGTKYKPVSCLDDELEDLLDICGYFGMTEDEVMYLLEMGYSYDEIEEFLWNPSLYQDEICAGCEL